MSSKHVKSKLPRVSKPNSLPVKIPLQIIRPASDAAGIVVRVNKVETVLADLQKNLAVESAARINLTKRVGDLETENIEVKKFLTQEHKEVRLKTGGGRAQSLQVFMKMLPCSTLDELNCLRDCVEIRTNFVHWTDFVKLIGGSDFNTSIKMIFNATMAKSVQKQLSWTGQRTTKPSLKYKYKAILDGIHVAMKENFENYTIALGEEKMKKLL